MKSLLPARLAIPLLMLAACRAAGSGSPEAVGPPAAQVEIFSPGVISDDRWQYRITFTPDGRTAYYTAADSFFPRTRRSTILVSHLRGGVWSSPQTAPFSGTYTDIDPFITPDGRRLYFASIRPVEGVQRSDLDIWMVERTRTGWSEPVRLGAEVNSPSDELYASAAADGTLYFAGGPAGPAPTADDEFHPTISRDGRHLYFARTLLSPTLRASDFHVVPMSALSIPVMSGGSGAGARSAGMPRVGMPRSPGRRAR